MSLSIAVASPELVLAKGEHKGFEWVVVNNGMGHRCGYVRVPVGHPWHGKGYEEVDATVHGGLTYGESGDPGGDGSSWLGFDCAHHGDARDPSLPSGSRLDTSLMDSLGLAPLIRGHVWSQEEVEAECRSLCEQAAAAA